MKNILKSKMGFTLIELLVVIGILAVLAAIAIPSVAGLIDRANVSADATNANEMTNAIERFTSEYELYCQDLASGRVKTGDLDSAQGRVFNVTGADSREDVELLESTGLDGKQINRDTKYPTNTTTMQSLVENYMKTSSTTFTPKQSDCHYYYSPDCGVVVCTETAKSSTTDLNKLIQSGKDAKGNTLGADTEWIDLTSNTSIDNGNNNENAYPAGSATFAYYYDYDNNGARVEGPFTLTWEEVMLPENGEKFCYFVVDVSAEYGIDGEWGGITNTKIAIGAFSSSTVSSIVVPEGVTTIQYGFNECLDLKSIWLPSTLTNITEAFPWCGALDEVYYNGTTEQWHNLVNNVTVGNSCYGVSEVTVTCTDGVVIVPVVNGTWITE